MTEQMAAGIPAEEANERKTAVSVKMSTQTRDLFRDYVAGTGMTQEDAIRHLIEKAQTDREKPKTDLYRALTAELEPHLEAILNVLRTAYGATETAVLAERQKAEAAMQKAAEEKESLLETMDSLQRQLKESLESEKELQGLALKGQEAAKKAKEEQQKAEAREETAKEALTESQEVSRSIRASLEGALERVKQLEAETAKMTQLEAELKNSREDTEAEKAKVRDLEKETEITAVKVNAMQEKLEKAETDAKQAREDLAVYKRMYEDVFMQLTDTRRELGEAQKEITALTRQIAESTSGNIH